MKLVGVRTLLLIVSMSEVMFAASGAAQVAVPASSGRSANEASPVLAFDGRVVKATNVPPGSQVVFFALGLVPNGFSSRVTRWSKVVVDDDRDGAITFDAGSEVPCKSIWAVVEVAMGNFAVAAPKGCPLRHADALSSRSFKRRSKTDADSFVQAKPYLDLLYVEPGRGAWTIRAADGSPADEDGQPGVITVALAGANSLVPNQARPVAFVPGGVLVAIDLYTLDVVAERLDAKMLAEVLP